MKLYSENIDHLLKTAKAKWGNENLIMLVRKEDGEKRIVMYDGVNQYSFPTNARNIAATGSHLFKLEATGNARHTIMRLEENQSETNVFSSKYEPNFITADATELYYGKVVRKEDEEKVVLVKQDEYLSEKPETKKLSKNRVADFYPGENFNDIYVTNEFDPDGCNLYKIHINTMGSLEIDGLIAYDQFTFFKSCYINADTDPKIYIAISNNQSNKSYIEVYDDQLDFINIGRNIRGLVDNLRELDGNMVFTRAYNRKTTVDRYQESGNHKELFSIDGTIMQLQIGNKYLWNKYAGHAQ